MYMYMQYHALVYLYGSLRVFSLVGARGEFEYSVNIRIANTTTDIAFDDLEPLLSTFYLEKYTASDWLLVTFAIESM